MYLTKVTKGRSFHFRIFQQWCSFLWCGGVERDSWLVLGTYAIWLAVRVCVCVYVWSEQWRIATREHFNGDKSESGRKTHS